MAMLTTRNLEYILYIASLVYLARSPRLKSWGFWSAIGCMALLMASDKLFFTISIGGAFLALVVYARARCWAMVSSSVNWLIAGVIAAIGAASALWLISATGVTRIASQSGVVGPYGLVHNLHSMALGVIYAVLGLLTDFGANPAFDATRLRDIPGRLQAHLVSPGGITYLINAAILAAGLVMAIRLVTASLSPKENKKTHFDNKSLLSIMLIWTTLAAFGSFIVSNHYYVVDARYLTISLFAIFIAGATFISKRHWQPEKVVLAGLVIAVGIVLGITSAVQNYSDDKNGLATLNLRNSVISQVLSRHPVTALVGDYWRVIPIKLASGNTVNVMPLAGCTLVQNVLSSKVWQPDLHSSSFAYLLSLDVNLTNYPSCTLKQVTHAYGRPNASALIAGSLSQPKELLLFYDHGTNNSAPKTPQPPKGPATVLPITLDQLPYTTCPAPTIMNVVAHQDDDLLFMNPDTIHDIKAGHCVRTVYVTAGDSGIGQFYWLSREQGSEAAYSAMVGTTDVWVQRIVELSNHEFVTIANPRGNSQISLIFMHLPDGNLKGEGFKTSRYESLAKLNQGKLSVLHTVDGQSTYTSSELINALSSFMHTYQPAEIRTQANYISAVYPDHSDHMTVGTYVQRAHKQFDDQQYGGQVIIPLKFYIGYPIHQMSANVSGADLAQKETVFLNYAKFDHAACQSLTQCQRSSTYGAYLAREYQNAY
jgi:LmbE family N-acetylglucosaminyl deacetylase